LGDLGVGNQNPLFRFAASPIMEGEEKPIIVYKSKSPLGYLGVKKRGTLKRSLLH